MKKEQTLQEKREELNKEFKAWHYDERLNSALYLLSIISMVIAAAFCGLAFIPMPIFAKLILLSISGIFLASGVFELTKAIFEHVGLNKNKKELLEKNKELKLLEAKEKEQSKTHNMQTKSTEQAKSKITTINRTKNQKENVEDAEQSELTHE